MEVCPGAGVIAQQLAQRLEENGGVALIADYGHTGDKTDTFRVSLHHSEESRNHKQELGVSVYCYHLT